MPRGLSIHVGLDEVDARHYEGWTGSLQHGEHDARDMRAMAEALGYEATLLVGRHATWVAVTRAIGSVAEALGPGETFLLTYSGYGAAIGDPGAPASSTSSWTPAWALHDRLLVESEWWALLAGFHAGVRVVIVADTCHRETTRGDSALTAETQRALPDAVAHATLVGHPDVYPAHAAAAAIDLSAVRASVIVLEACQKNQTAVETARNGLFTSAVLAVWRNGGFRGGYGDFHRAVQLVMPPWQSPGCFVVGARVASLVADRPFAI